MNIELAVANKVESFQSHVKSTDFFICFQNKILEGLYICLENIGGVWWSM